MKRSSIYILFLIFVLFISACSNAKTTFNVNDYDTFEKAIIKNDTELIKKYIQKGVNINTKDKEGFTPLMLSVQHSFIDTEKTLLTKGADFNAIDKNGSSVLLMAVSTSNIEVVKPLLDKKVDINYVNKNAQNYYSDTALSIAIYSGNINMVKLLIDSGADINLPDSSGLTPLAFANRESMQGSTTSQGIKDIAKLLTEKGAKEITIDMNSDTKEKIFTEGKNFYDKGDYENARIKLSELTQYTDLKYYNEVIQMYADSCIKVGQQYMEQKNYDLAYKVYFDAALAIKDKNTRDKFISLYCGVPSNTSSNGTVNTIVPKIGMTANEVLNSSWGKPTSINRTTTANNVREQWVYSNYRYIYLENNIVTAIQDHK